jgi:hypothetical protein
MLGLEPCIFVPQLAQVGAVAQDLVNQAFVDQFIPRVTRTCRELRQNLSDPSDRTKNKD